MMRMSLSSQKPKILRRTFASSSNDFIHQSNIPTYHFQGSLPRLPIPELNDTLKKYLKVVSPLVSSEQLQTTQKIVEEFQKNEGPKLHSLLLEKDKREKHTSYISEWWYDMYLRSRDPLPLNFNPFMIWRDDPKHAAQASRAASLVHSSLRVKATLDAEVLAPEVFFMKGEDFDSWFKQVVRYVPSSLSWYCAYLVNAYPLDMSQYNKLFGTARLPGETKDELKTHKNEKHIAVIRGGNFYRLDVLDKNGRVLPQADIEAGLKAIIADPSPALPHNQSPGVFTTLDRTSWWKLRNDLSRDETNRDSLEEIDEAIFVLCLDDVSLEEEQRNQLCTNFLYGDVRNRWFDKNFSIIVTKNGKAAVNFEHSWGDGVAVLRYMNETLKDTQTKALYPSSSSSTPSFRKLPFNLSADLQLSLDSAWKKFQSVIDKLDFHAEFVPGIGKNYFKSKSMSPDAAAQLSFQLAYKKMYGKTVSTYESSSTAAFRHGRTEAIRPATPESVEFVNSVLNNESKDVSLAKLKNAAKAHSEWVKDGAMGKGVDRHLFALRELSKQHNGSPAAIFKDPSYSTMGENILSTSTLISPYLSGGGFGPVHPNGYGVGYGVEDDRSGFAISSYGLKTKDFVSHIKESLMDIKSVLDSKGSN